MKYRKTAKAALCVLMSLTCTGLLVPSAAFGAVGGQLRSANTQNVMEEFISTQQEASSTLAATQKEDTTQTKEALANGIEALDAANDSYPATFDLRSCDLNNDGENESYVTSVKFQNPWGSCWGFSAVAASESSILSASGKTATDESGKDAINLSEKQLAWFATTELPDNDVQGQDGEGYHYTGDVPSNKFNKGGMMVTAATSVFSSGIGPVEESDDPLLEYRGIDENGLDASGNYNSTKKYNENRGFYYYSDEDDWTLGEDLRFVQDYELEESNMLPNPAGTDENGEYQYDENATNVIKSELQAGRAVSVAFCADTSRPTDDPVNATNKYINTDTWAHYTYDSSATINHGVTIVGWDDNYSKENFLSKVTVFDTDGNPVYNSDGTLRTKTVEQPPADGAWIVKNSWGSVNGSTEDCSYNNWGNEGYFYLSYYDKSLSELESFEYDVSEDGMTTSNGGYIIDQYDYMPISNLNGLAYDDDFSMANVFTTSEDETVRALSCNTVIANTQVTYRLYRLNANYTSPTDGQLLEEQTVDYDYAGYHRIDLNRAWSMPKGSAYSVVVEQTLTAGENAGYHVLATSRNINKNYYDVMGNVLGLELTGYYKGVVNEGESYLVAADGTATDYTVLIDEMKDVDSLEEVLFYDYDNFPIRAYSDFGLESGLDVAKAKVTVSPASATYTGKAITPAVTVTLGGKTLTRGTDYTVSYSNNKAAGKATVTVYGTGKNGYYGKATATFTIAKAAQSTAKISTAATKTFKSGKKGKLTKAKTFKLKTKGIKGSAKVVWTKANKAGKGRISVSKTGKVTLKKGLKKGIYKVKVKATVKATANYKAKTITKTIKVVVKK